MSIYACRYAGDSAKTVPIDLESDLDALLLQLREAAKEGASGRWKACLIQLNSDMRMAVKFEYDDLDRWKLTPDNIDKMIEAIRPD
jgi:hypothetical protein